MQVVRKDSGFYADYGDFSLLNGERSRKIFLAVRQSDSTYFAVKVEEITNERRIKRTNKQQSGTLEHENAVYKHLCGKGVPFVHWFGAVDGYRVMVMDLTGPALAELFSYCRRRFSLKTVLMLADQMFDRLQSLHDAGYVHGDITPDNFVLGNGKDSTRVYLVNMKWASSYVKFHGTRSTKNHISYRENVKFYGSPWYASINRHLGTVASRRDDLESCVYIIIYFLIGSLPWHIYRESTENLEEILAMKISISSEALCNGLPAEFAMILNYCRALKFEAEPNYFFIRQLLRNLFRSSAFEEDWNFDWMFRCCARQQLSRTF